MLPMKMNLKAIHLQRRKVGLNSVSKKEQFYWLLCLFRPPLWSSGQSLWLQIQRSRVRSPALPDFLSSSGSGTGSTQPREHHEVN